MKVQCCKIFWMKSACQVSERRVWGLMQRGLTLWLDLSDLDIPVYSLGGGLWCGFIVSDLAFTVPGSRPWTLQCERPQNSYEAQISVACSNLDFQQLSMPKADILKSKIQTLFICFWMCWSMIRRIPNLVFLMPPHTLPILARHIILIPNAWVPLWFLRRRLFSKRSLP